MSTDQLEQPLSTAYPHFELPGGEALLNKWIFEFIRPYIKGRVLEMGSGLAALSIHCVEQGIPIHLSDEEISNCEKLRATFSGNPVVRKVHIIDFYEQDFPQIYASNYNVFNTILALNITQHQLYKQPAYHNAIFFLRQRGFLMSILPASTVPYYGSEGSHRELKIHNAKAFKFLLGTNLDLVKIKFFKLSATTSMLLNSESYSLLALIIARKK